ncbi:MAG: hypothetical protein WDZ76_01260 [Pseudohongiellaceae bacterium]
MNTGKELYQEYLKHPSQNFGSPYEVLEKDGLNDEQKYEILQSWKLDEEEQSVATDENMEGGEGGNRISEVVDALSRLDLPKMVDPGDDK